MATTVLAAMLVVMIASVTALAASDSDNGLSRDDVNGKRAYAAAEAGLADYGFSAEEVEQLLAAGAVTRR